MNVQELIEKLLTLDFEKEIEYFVPSYEFESVGIDEIQEYEECYVII